MRQDLEHNGREVVIRYIQSYSKRDPRNVCFNARCRISQSRLVAIFRLLLACFSMGATLVATTIHQKR